MPSRAPSREALGTGSSRALNASEVGALRAESDRLLRLEQELRERQRQMNEKEEKWEASIKDMRAQLDVAQLGGGDDRRAATLEAELEVEKQRRRQQVAGLEARATQLEEMLERLGRKYEQTEQQRASAVDERDVLTEALRRAMQEAPELPPLAVQTEVAYVSCVFDGVGGGAPAKPQAVLACYDGQAVAAAALAAELRDAERLQFEGELWRAEEARVTAAALAGQAAGEAAGQAAVSVEVRALEAALALHVSDAAELAALLRAQLQAAADAAAAVQLAESTTASERCSHEAEAEALRALVAAVCAEADAAAAEAAEAFRSGHRAGAGAAREEAREEAAAQQQRVAAALAEAREDAAAALQAAAADAAARAAGEAEERGRAAATLREALHKPKVLEALLKEAMAREVNLRREIGEAGRSRAELELEMARLTEDAEELREDAEELHNLRRELELSESQARGCSKGGSQWGSHRPGPRPRPKLKPQPQPQPQPHC